MDDLQDVYKDLIMEHSMNSYNKKHLDNPDFCEIGHNPNCGDEITLELKLNGNVIEDISFEADEKKDQKIIVTKELVASKLDDIVDNVDTARYIL